MQVRIEKDSSAFYAMVAHLMVGGTSHDVFRRSLIGSPCAGLWSIYVLKGLCN